MMAVARILTLAALLLVSVPAFADQDADDLIAAQTGYAYAVRLKTIAQADLKNAQKIGDPDQIAAAPTEVAEALAEHDRAKSVSQTIVTRNTTPSAVTMARSLMSANP